MMFTTYKKRCLILLSILIAALLGLVGGFMLTQNSHAVAEDDAVDYAATVTFDGNTIEYATIEAAFDYANGLATTEGNSVEIKMFADAVTTDTLTVATSKNITLDLNGRMLEYDNADTNNSVITVLGTFTLKDSSFAQSGVITGGTGSEFQSGGEAVTFGGGVYVLASGTFTMTGGTISGNTAEAWADDSAYGGGVYVADGGAFTMTDGKISGNTAYAHGTGNARGGGVYVIGTFEMNGGDISENTAKELRDTAFGGGVFVDEDGTFTMSGGTISENTADAGGGVSVIGTFEMTGGKVSGNTAATFGGGVYVSVDLDSGIIPEEVGTFKMTVGEISGNTAMLGGGVCILVGNFTMENGTISGNTGEYGAGGVLLAAGMFEMKGGTISGNTQTADIGYGYCAGVCIGYDVFADAGMEATFKISGAPVISDNTVVIEGETVDINVVLCIGNKITVTGALTEGAKIGVTVDGDSGAGEIATGFMQNDNPSKHFVSDNPAYNCVFVSDKATGTVTIGTHNYAEDFTVDKRPTCTVEGSKSKHCALCDEKSEVTEIAALGHDFGEFVTDKQPTCTEEGSKSKHCTRCDEKTDVTAIPTIAHTLNHNPATPATNDKEGNIEYWDCEDCEKIFSDEDGTTEITDKASIVIPKLTGDKSDDNSALWITVIILAIIVLALGGYIAFDVLRGKRNANGADAHAAEPSAAEKLEPHAAETSAVEDEPTVAEEKAEEPAPEQTPETPVAAEPQAATAKDVPQIEPAPKAEKKTAEKKPTKSAAEKKPTKSAAEKKPTKSATEKKSNKPTAEKKAEPKAAKPKPAPKAQSHAKEEKNKIAQNISSHEAAAVIQRGDEAVETKPAVESKVLPPDEVRAEVTATEVDKIMTDEVAESFVERSETSSDKTKQGIINIDMLSQYFDGGEVVTLDEIKKRVNGFNKKTTYIKVLARGTLDKALTVEADSFSLQAVKMIVLTGGKVIKKQS